MNLRIRIVLIGVLAIASVALPAVAEARNSRFRVVTVDVKLTEVALTDVTGNGASSGDTVTFSLSNGGRIVGYGVCTIVTPGHEVCTNIVALGSGGSIVLSFNDNTSALVNHAAVTGGTQKYAGTRGDATVIQLSKDDTTRYRIRARLLP